MGPGRVRARGAVLKFYEPLLWLLSKILRAQVLGLEQGCSYAARRPGADAYAGWQSPVRRIILWADQPIK